MVSDLNVCLVGIHHGHLIGIHSLRAADWAEKKHENCTALEKHLLLRGSSLAPPRCGTLDALWLRLSCLFLFSTSVSSFSSDNFLLVFFSLYTGIGEW